MNLLTRPSFCFVRSAKIRRPLKKRFERKNGKDLFLREKTRSSERRGKAVTCEMVTTINRSRCSLARSIVRALKNKRRRIESYFHVERRRSKISVFRGESLFSQRIDSATNDWEGGREICLSDCNLPKSAVSKKGEEKTRRTEFENFKWTMTQRKLVFGDRTIKAKCFLLSICRRETLASHSDEEYCRSNKLD